MNWKKHIFNWALFFLLFLLFFQFFGKNGEQKDADGADAFEISLTDDSYSVGQTVALRIKNNTEKPVALPVTCPQNPFRVLRYENGEFTEVLAKTSIDCKRVNAFTLKPGKTQVVNFSYWNYALFGTPGRYKIEVPIEEKTLVTHEFDVKPRGVFGILWNGLFFQPIYNALILFVSISPGKSLGMAIIVLTLLIRLILLVPSQRAMKSQRAMQEIQPKLDHIKKKYKGNQEKIAQETMAIWKKHKVNPFGSCLPLLIQLPILIALYHVIQSGLNPDNIHLLYAPLKNFNLNAIHSDLLGILDLTKINVLVLPIIIGLLQFIQMKLAFAKRQPAKNTASFGNELQMANNMMLYFMPALIAVFTASVPAGVALYWGVSTLFGIGQQLVINKQFDGEKKDGIIEGEIVQDKLDN